FDVFEQAVQTGDAAWLDAVLYDWANSSTESDLVEGQKNATQLLNFIFSRTADVARETLEENDALDLIIATLPIFTQALDKTARMEMETRVAYYANEVTDVQQKLERLDRSKSNFISVAAHELKTPLTLVEGYTAMMGDVITRIRHSDNMDPLLRGVQTGIQRLRQIVDDMIDVSLIDNNMLSLNPQPVWVGHILDLLGTNLETFVLERRQTFELRRFPGSQEMLFADPERLYQAFQNVLTNAIKYTPDGGSITVDGRVLPGFVEVTVADTGIGISPEDQALIFEKFGALGRADLHSSSKIKFKGGGPGLGLSIAKGIIEAHGGTIWAESEGHDEKACPGSTFHILLPIRAEGPDPRISKLFGDLANGAPAETSHVKEETRTDAPAA
ncbi:MAG: HAMP domain-containing sensor histidine kinase, partial [Chloroflexota bacterium]